MAALYRAIREAPDGGHQDAWARFRTGRDGLFRSHPDSPLFDTQRAAFRGLAYFPYDPAWRLTGSLDAATPQASTTVDLGADDVMRYTRVAVARFTGPAGPAMLNLYWIEGYGGGLFLPFRDWTSGKETFGGGRYLYDTLKGADLGSSERAITLDFNYAYNPSCAYHEHWVCPLAPPENALAFAVRAGELAFA